ncbi:MAG: hypothetical protein RL095_2876 [Verrucomicrobiota bacterium]|jgi:hypothetical protein
MRIANPLYDSVFKFLMDDPECARTVIATITGLDIDKVEPRPTEMRAEVGGGLLVYRLDFCAHVKLANGGFQLVLIEIQKAKEAEDIMRFRRYLGQQYSNPANVVPGLPPDTVPQPLPVLAIYLLGHKLSGLPEVPAIKVARQQLDAITGKKLVGHSPFIECLTHESFIIQIPNLHDAARNSLESLLKVFDQHRKDSQDGHTLIIDESQLPEEFRPVLRRLSRAGESEEMRQRMTIEDEYLDDLRRRERRTQRLEEERDKAEADKQKAEADKQKAEADKQKAEADKQKAEAQARRDKLVTAESLRDMNLSEAQISKATGIDLTQLEAWIRSGRP